MNESMKNFFFFTSFFGCAGSSLLHWGFLLSPVLEGGGFSLVTVHRLLTGVASLAAKHGL